MRTPLGAHSPKLAAVRDLLTKKGRREQRRFVFEGPTLLAEALAGGVAIEAIFASEAAADRLGPIEAEIFIVNDAAIKRISDLETPSGLLAVAPIAFAELSGLLAAEGPILYLCGIADPGNAGTLMRTAEAFGAAGIVFGENAVEPHNPKVLRASMGAIFRLPIALAAGTEIVRAAKEAGRSLIVATTSGVPIEHFTFPPRAIYAIGNERHGAGALPTCDATIAITQVGSADSLNAAVAGSIVLYEATRTARA